MNYTPNFNDPRTIARIKQAMGFACGVMSLTKPHGWSSRYIDKYFGMSGRPLSKYLRNTLLICTDEFYLFNQSNPKENKCKEYILNLEGVKRLTGVLMNNNIQLYPSVVEVAQEPHKEELETGVFTYKDLSNRFWHPLQKYRKCYRTQILTDHGYLHDYDIECAAPTLIHQHAQHLGMDLYLFALNKYLADRTHIRQQLAHKLELDTCAVKEIINALFAGARISCHTDSDIYHILNGDLARIEFLKQDEFITELRNDIDICWEYITPTLSRRRNAKTNRLLPIISKQKWNVYFELERVIINSVRTYLDEREVKHFLIHDGWTCESEINKNELIEYVRNQTGFDVKFDYVKLTQSSNYPSVTDLLKGNENEF
jgi:hypothetical protein